MKRVICILLLAALTLAFAACGQDQEPAPTTPAPSVSEALPTETPTQAPTQTPESPAPTAGGAPQDEGEKKIDYRGIYRRYLEMLIERNGVCELDENTGLMGGILYADVLDFDGDGVPELTYVCGSRAYLCAIRQQGEGWEVAQLLEEAAGGEYGHTDVCLQVRFPTVDGKPYIVLNHTQDEWCQDSWTAYTLEQGELKSRTFFAETDGENEFPDDEFLVDCEIDGETVSPEAYRAEKDKFYAEGTPAVDAAFVDEAAARSALEALLARLAG